MSLSRAARSAEPSARSVANLIYGLAEAIDDADGPRMAELLGDATFVLGDNPPRVGGEAFAAMVERGMIRYDGSPRTHHVVTNLVISIDDSSGGAVVATARSQVTVLQAVPPDFPLQAVLGGRYEDRFGWTDDGWAWVERRMAITHRGDTSRHSVHQL
jgi:hypothetical protein